MGAGRSNPAPQDLTPMNTDTLLEENQIIGTGYGFGHVRDLYQRPDGSRYSVRKSGTWEGKQARGLTPEQIIAAFPVNSE